ncbi:MAG: Spy/CpxP family protein refolding chaperone [Nitrospiraceae bacterium]
MKSQIRLKTILVAALTTVTLTASACHRSQSPAERAQWMADKIAKELELDATQKTKLAAAKDEFIAARASAQQEHRALMETLLAQVQSDRLDQTKLARLFEQHQALQRQTLDKVLPKVAEWHASLTPEQKAEAVEHIRRWMEH